MNFNDDLNDWKRFFLCTKSFIMLCCEKIERKLENKYEMKKKS